MTTFLPLPRLDDRRWEELVEEGRALIPLYAPDWTDHNVSDPGITLTELFAWLAEMQGFQLDQVPISHRLEFLGLVGLSPAPPKPARTVLRFGLTSGAGPLALPEGVECEGENVSGTTVPYRTLRELAVVDARVEELESRSDAATVDLTRRWLRGETFAPFGEDPRPGVALVLALSAALPPGVRVTLFVSRADAGSEDERAQIERAEELRAAACRTPESLIACERGEEEQQAEKGDRCGEPVDGPLLHHSARTVWELEVAPGRWRPLDPAAGEVVDYTRALTLDGRVEIVAPVTMHSRASARGTRFLLRCRFVRGEYDAPPTLRDVSLNALEAEQAVPAHLAWRVAPAAAVTEALEVGRNLALGAELDDELRIRSLDPTDAWAPVALLLAYEEAEPLPEDPPPPGTPPPKDGAFVVEAIVLGLSDGSPEQVVSLDAVAEAGSLRIWTLERGAGSSGRRWSLRPDLKSSGPADAHVVFDAGASTIAFGDGERGLVPPPSAAIVALYRTTLAQDGDLPAGAVSRVAGSAHNDAVLPAGTRDLLNVKNPVPATGGAAAETLEHAEGRAAELLDSTGRAVTLADYERLARETPGVRIARAAARANVHPGFPCVDAVGVVTVVVVPTLPARRPVPSPGLLKAVAGHLATGRVVGTRIAVTGPTYTAVSVRARVSALRVASRGDVAHRVAEAIDAFFDPLAGGPDGAGWPLGRDVIRAEVLQVIDGVGGVDHVVQVDLVTRDGRTCGNVCVGPLGLVAAGEHTIEVIAA